MFVSWLSTSLAERRHRIHVLCSHSDQNLPDEMQCAGIDVLRVPYLQGIMQRNPHLLIKAQKSMSRVVREFHPDVVHLHVGGPIVHAYLSCPAFRGIPLVVTVHDLPAATSSLPTLEQVLRKANSITTNSRIRLNDVKQLEPTIRERAQCIYVGKPTQADCGIFERSPHPLIFMVGRLVAEKGFDLAIAAFSEVHKRHSSAQLLLAGKGPMHEALRELIDHYGLNDSVQLLGEVSAEALDEYYGRSWFTLVPSRHSESFGLVALEAMQAGRPVIASKTGGLPEVIEDGITGRLVEPNSAAALAQAMLELLNDPIGIIKMGQAAKERAHSLFAWEQCVNGYEEALMRAARQ